MNVRPPCLSLAEVPSRLCPDASIVRKYERPTTVAQPLRNHKMLGSSHVCAALSVGPRNSYRQLVAVVMQTGQLAVEDDLVGPSHTAPPKMSPSGA